MEAGFVEAARDDAERLALRLPENDEIVAPTHWRFGQLASLVGAPASYRRPLPAPLANLEHPARPASPARPVPRRSDIAFFMTSTVVKQRLKLAAVAPALLDLYADDAMSLEQLMAFTVNPDISCNCNRKTTSSRWTFARCNL